MAKGRPNPNWRQRVLEWQASGMRCQAWCKVNQIPYTTFLGWKKRSEISSKEKLPNVRSSGFIELKDQPIPSLEEYSGISLEYHGIKIRLNAGFNPIVLKQCLSCLGGVTC